MLTYQLFFSFSSFSSLDHFSWRSSAAFTVLKREEEDYIKKALVVVDDGS